MLGVGLIVLACTCWALDAIIRYPLLSQISPSSLVFYEHLLLCLIFAFSFFKSRQKFWHSEVSHLSYFFVIGGIGSAYATLAFTQAFYYINPSVVILLQKLQPLVAILLARVVLKEAVQKKFLFWGALALIGGACVSFEDLRSGLGGVKASEILSSSGFKGILLALAAVAGWGSATVFGKKLTLVGFNPLEIVSGRFLVGFLCMIPAFVIAGPTFLTTPLVFGKLIVMVVLSGALGMYFYYKGLSKISARVCAIAELFFPFCAIIANWIFLGKSLTPVQIAGGVLLVTGSTVLQLKRY